MTGDKDWTIRPYRGGDERGILDCLTEAFERWPGIDIDVPSSEHLRWKLSSPRVEGLHYVVEAEGQIVGTRLLISQQWLVKARVMDCTKSTDLSISREFRGRGIFPRLWHEHEDACRGRYGLSLGFTDIPYLRAHMTHQGHRTPANPLEHLNRNVEEGDPVASAAGLRVEREDAFDGGVAELVAAAAEEFDLLSARPVAYLNWRYADPRAGRFAIYIARDGGTVLGYAVLTQSRGRAFIADLLVLPGRIDVLAALLNEANLYACARGVASLRTWCVREHPYRETLLAHGFTRAREETSVSIMSYGPDIGFVYSDQYARLHIVPGDTDVV